MSKNLENDYKTKSEPKHLSGTMVTAYCPDSDILILKCQCCNKVIAYCCHCNPILQSLSETNLNRASIDSNHNSAFTNSLHHNVVVPIFDINHNTNSNNLTNSNIKKTNPVVLEDTSSLDNPISLVTNNIVDSNEVVTASKTNKLEDEKQIQHIAVENNVATKLETNSLENIVNKQDTTQQKVHLEMMHFCYKVETKLGELNVGVNHYQVLELSYKATRSEIQNAYLRLLSEFNINNIKNISLPKYDLESQVNLIIEAVNQAAKTLLNSSLRSQYDKEIFEELNKNIIIDNKINSEAIYNKVILSHHTSDNNKNNNQGNKIPQTSLSEQFNALITIDKPEKPIISLPPKLNKPLIKIDNNYSINPKKIDPTVERQNNISSNNSYSNSQLLSENDVEVDIETNIEADIERESLVSEQNNIGLIQAKPAVKLIDNTVVRRKPITGYMIKPEELKNAREESPIANDLYALSIKCYESLHYERAISPLQKALELNPNNAIYWAQLGKTYSKIHNSQHRAESAYKEAVRICPDNLEYLTELAALYKSLGKPSQAGEIFQTIFQLKYQNSVFYQKLKSIIVKFSSSRERKHKASQERQNNFKLKISSYFKSLADWLSLLLIVISYKLSSRKNSSTSKQTDK